MIGLLPPAGEPVCFSSSADIIAGVPGYEHRFYQSGTAALAAAMMIVRERRPDLAVPEVLVPAWGCPDLIAAALYAGLKPVLVDVHTYFHGFDEAALSAAVSDQCVAILLVNYLGIHERRQFWRAYRDQQRPDIALIEDNAQWWPEPVDGQSSLYGDLSICSFGRGKPVSLLGGGCLFKRSDWSQTFPSPRPAHASKSDALKMRLFNLLLHPYLYRVMDSMPGLHLGQTVYHALGALEDMDAYRLALLASNVRRHEQASRAREDWWRQALDDMPGLTQAVAVAPEGAGRLLRMPILLEQASLRDALIRALKRSGIGATAMYAKPLHKIQGVAEVMPVMGCHFPAAQHYAERMLTLPLHSGLRQRHVEAAVSVFRQYLTR